MTNKEAIAQLNALVGRVIPASGGPVWYAEIMGEAVRMATEAIERNQWTPVTERLPGYRQTVIVSSYWGVTVAYRDAVKEDGTDDFWCLLLSDSDTSQRNIYAWMPLPEPWGGDTG